MKQKLLLLIGLSTAIYATQEISCVEFVNMPKAEAKAYIDNYRKSFELNHFKTKNHTEIDKQYIGMQGGVSKHLLTCIDLRRATYYGVEDVRRALILEVLSKKNLTPEEENIYRASLNRNIAFYKPYSNSSIKNAQSMPLVFLTIQRSNQNYVVYESRKNGSTVKRYTKKISVANPFIIFSTKNSKANQNYLSYLNNNSINPQLKIIVNEVNNNKYSVIKAFNAIKTFDNVEYRIEKGSFLIKTKETKSKIYFLINNEEYFACELPRHKWRSFLETLNYCSDIKRL